LIAGIAYIAAPPIKTRKKVIESQCVSLKNTICSIALSAQKTDIPAKRTFPNWVVNNSDTWKNET
jgi:hypothetical protein